MLLMVAVWPALAYATGRPALLSHPRTAACMAETALALSTKDVAILFGKMAEKELYLDPAVGACCHSACSDCEWRLPDGGYRFDLMKATQRKWIPLYFKRDFGDERGCGLPRWAETIFPACVKDASNKTPVTKTQFADAIAALDFDSPMGPRGKVSAAELSAKAVDAFWEYLANGAEVLEPSIMRSRLQALSEDSEGEGAVGEGPDGLVWKEFAKGLGVKPFEMIV